MWPGNSWRSLRAHTPLSEPTSRDRATLGVKTKWAWRVWTTVRPERMLGFGSQRGDMDQRYDHAREDRDAGQADTGGRPGVRAVGDPAHGQRPGQLGLRRGV